MKNAVMCFLLLLATSLSLQKEVYATDNHEYKPHEFAIIHDGISPNHRFSIATHGEGGLGDQNFHVYLFAEPKHKKIGVLEEIDSFLDTGPGSYAAAWSSDSRHVAILYRSDRHMFTMTMFTIGNGRAYVVTGPSLIDIVSKGKPDPIDINTRYIDTRIKWLSPTRFYMEESNNAYSEQPGFRQKLGKFVMTDVDEPTSVRNTKLYWAYFGAHAICEVLPNNRYRTHSVKPGGVKGTMDLPYH